MKTHSYNRLAIDLVLCTACLLVGLAVFKLMEYSVLESTLSVFCFFILIPFATSLFKTDFKSGDQLQDSKIFRGIGYYTCTFIIFSIQPLLFMFVIFLWNLAAKRTRLNVPLGICPDKERVFNEYLFHRICVVEAYARMIIHTLAIIIIVPMVTAFSSDRTCSTLPPVLKLFEKRVSGGITGISTVELVYVESCKFAVLDPESIIERHLSFTFGDRGVNPPLKNLLMDILMIFSYSFLVTIAIATFMKCLSFYNDRLSSSAIYNRIAPSPKRERINFKFSQLKDRTVVKDKFFLVIFEGDDQCIRVLCDGDEYDAAEMAMEDKIERSTGEEFPSHYYCHVKNCKTLSQHRIKLFLKKGYNVWSTREDA